MNIETDGFNSTLTFPEVVMDVFAWVHSSLKVDEDFYLFRNIVVKAQTFALNEFDELYEWFSTI